MNPNYQKLYTNATKLLNDCSNQILLGLMNDILLQAQSERPPLSSRCPTTGVKNLCYRFFLAYGKNSYEGPLYMIMESMGYSSTEGVKKAVKRAYDEGLINLEMHKAVGKVTRKGKKSNSEHFTEYFIWYVKISLTDKGYKLIEKFTTLGAS
jgi:hypothetical protein